MREESCCCITGQNVVSNVVTVTSSQAEFLDKGERTEIYGSKRGYSTRTLCVEFGLKLLVSCSKQIFGEGNYTSKNSYLRGRMSVRENRAKLTLNS